MQRLGARSIPVLSRGDKFVFAQNIAQVVEFLKLNEKTGPVLSPAQLVERMTRFIDAAVTLVPLMPDDRLDTEVPNRPRKYRVLAHHMFRIPESFVEIAGGEFFSEKLPVATPDPADMASTEALAAYGRPGARTRSRHGGARRRTNRRNRPCRPITARRSCMRCSNARPGISASTPGNG